MELVRGAMIDSRRSAQMKNVHNSVRVLSLSLTGDAEGPDVESILRCGRVSGWR